MNTNFEGILPVGFPIDAPWDERFAGSGSLIAQVSVPGANRRWVRVNLPTNTPVIEATTWDDQHTGMPCKYLAVPTYYKGLISWAATPFRPGVPNNVDTGYFDIEETRTKVAICTYNVPSKISGIKTYPIAENSVETWAVATARITVSKLQTFDDHGNVYDLYVLPTLCNDGVIVKRRLSEYRVVYQQVSHIDDGDQLPLAIDYSPQDVVVCKLTDRTIRPDDGLTKFGMLFSMNVPLGRMNSQTVSLAPAIFSNAIQPVIADTEGHYDSITVVIEELPITIQSEAGAAAPATSPGADVDLSGVEAKLQTLDVDLTTMWPTTNAKLQALNDNVMASAAAERANFASYMFGLVNAVSKLVPTPEQTSAGGVRTSSPTF